MVRRVHGDDFGFRGQRSKLRDLGAGSLEPRLVAPGKNVADFVPSTRVAPGEVLRDELAREARGAEDDEVEVAWHGPFFGEVWFWQRLKIETMERGRKD